MMRWWILCLFGTLCACARKTPAEGSTAKRIVSLSPSTTETLFAIGAGESLVGRSRYCNYPQQALTRPIVGGFTDPNFEAIVALRPTLVVGARGPAGATVTRTLEGYNVATYFPETESLRGIDEMVLGLGERTGHAIEARNWSQVFHQKLSQIENETKSLAKKKVLLVFGTAPVVAAGPHGFPDEMIAAAGGINVIGEGPAYPTLPAESIASLTPDIVIDAAWGEGRIRPDKAPWNVVFERTKSARLIVLSDESILRPGPRVLDGILRLKNEIFPERKVNP